MRTAILALLFLSAAAPARADDTEGFLRLGSAYHVGAPPADARLNPFSYPAVSIDGRSPKFHGELHSQAVVAIPDAIAAGILFLSGHDARLPLMNAMNGRREPGDVDFFSGAASFTILGDRTLATEAGAQGALSWMSPYVNGERIPLESSSVGPRLGQRFELGRASFDEAVFAGNAWTQHAAWNPYVGASTRAHWRLNDRFGLYLDGTVTEERLDLRNVTAPDTGVRIDTVDWYTLGRIEAGVTFSVGR